MTTTPPEEPRGSEDPTSPSTGQAPPPPPGGATPPPPPPSGATPPPPGATPPPPGPQGPPPGYQAPPPGYQGAPQGYAGAPQGYAGAGMSDNDQRLWAMLAHLSGILFWVLGPLVIWLIYKDRGSYVNEQSKEALNFQIAHLIVQVALWIVVGILTVVTFGIGALLGVLFWFVWIAMIVFAIIAGVAANKGQAYRYPVNLRLVK